MRGIGEIIQDLPTKCELNIKLLENYIDWEIILKETNKYK